MDGSRSFLVITGAHNPERATPILGVCHGVFTDQFILGHALFPSKAGSPPCLSVHSKNKMSKRITKIKREKENYIIFRSVGFADWFVECKRYLNSRQNRSKNKLVHENSRDLNLWKLFTPGYGLLAINDVIMT